MTQSMMKRVFFTTCASALMVVAGCAHGGTSASGAVWVFPGATWERHASPEAAGYAAAALAGARDSAARLRLGGVLVVSGGKIVDEWGTTTEPIVIQSARKSVLSALFGIYHAEGRIDTERTLRELNVDDEQSLTATEQEARIEDLLRARSGVYHPAAAEAPSMIAARPARGSHPPGTFWYYNNWDFNALGTIFEQLTGRGIFVAMKERLAEPLQMEDFRVEHGIYQREAQSRHAAYHMLMSARDMARFGLLYARNGRWNDGVIVPSSWIERSTRSYSVTDRYGQTYGYMWWIGVPDSLFGYRHYAAKGGAGHGIYVVPELDLVVVTRSDPAARTTQFPGIERMIRAIVAGRRK